MALVHALFIPACALEVLVLRRPFVPAIGFAALAGALGAQGLRYWAIGSLGDRWNVRIIVLPGEPPVTRGPYRWLRHPNYLAVITEMACVPLIHGAWLSAIGFSLVNALLLSVRIPAEEKALGEAWRSEFAGKRRLVPLR
jgi:methyltransferase